MKEKSEIKCKNCPSHMVDPMDEEMLCDDCKDHFVRRCGGFYYCRLCMDEELEKS